MGHALVQIELLVLDADGVLAKEQVQILARRMIKKGNQAVTQVLVQWSSFPEDAMWEVLSELQRSFSQFDPSRQGSWQGGSI